MVIEFTSLMNRPTMYDLITTLSPERVGRIISTTEEVIEITSIANIPQQEPSTIPCKK